MILKNIEVTLAQTVTHLIFSLWYVATMLTTAFLLNYLFGAYINPILSKLTEHSLQEIFVMFSLFIIFLNQFHQFNTRKES